MKNRFRTAASSLAALVFFIFAIFLLHRLLREYHINDIRAAFHTIPHRKIILSACLTLLSYFFLTLYDRLAFIYIEKPLAYSKIALASFLSYAFANNTGTLSIIASSSIRYRFYSGWGLSGMETARIVWFCISSFWLGYLFLAGISFLFFPPTHIFSIPLTRNEILHFLGLVFLFLVSGYLGVTFRKKNIHFRQWQVRFPSFPLAFAQIAAAAADLLIASAALYVLLPDMPISFVSFLSLFLLATILGLMSNVPGGLGVFESIMLLMLTPYAKGPALISALLLYRCIYYLFPLAVSVCILGGLEISRRRVAIARMTSAFYRGISVFLPQVLALATLVSGGVLLFSGTMPAVYGRIAWLVHLMPLPVLELSHFLGSMVGMGLLILSSGLRRRLDMAYYLTVILLMLGIVFSLLKGLDYEESVWLSLVLAVLLVSRRQFFRKASILAEPVNPSWFVILFIIFTGSIGLGFFVYRHHDYSNELWWQFALNADAPRFMRASVGALVVLLFFGVARIFKPYQPSPSLPQKEDLERAAQIAAGSPDTSAYLALLGDKSLLFSESKNTFLMFGINGKSWIAMGDPVGEQQEAAELIWKFCTLAEHFNCWPVFHEVGAENLSWYVDLDMSILKIGEEGYVRLTDFDLTGKRHKGLRNNHNRLQREGYRFDIVSPEEVPLILSELKEISDEWLADKKAGEKGFSLGFFAEHYLCHFPVAVIRFEDRIMAFTNLWQGSGKKELSIDLMRYRNDAPNGIMEYIFCETMIWGKNRGYEWFNLGMVPLAGLEPDRKPSLWRNIGTFVYRHGEHFYNFKGLRSYKNKFDPVWHPRYLVYPGGLKLPAILANLTALISGSVKKVISR